MGEHIVYHAGTGTYFGLDDQVFLINVRNLPVNLQDDLEHGDEPDLYGYGLRLSDCLKYNVYAWT
jgi:hypothetical protein